MDEFEIIDRYFAPLADAQSVRLSDDVAELQCPEGRIIVTTDALVEGVHFLPSAQLEDVGWKLVAVNVSDCLAKGARPFAASLILAWPQKRSSEHIGAFATGLGDALRTWAVTLLGGDTVGTSGPLLAGLSLHAVCSSPRGPVRRHGGMKEDDLWVSGKIGDAALGLKIRRGILDPDTTDMSSLVRHYDRPRLPPAALADLVGTYATASIDLSDGLCADADKLAKASGVGVHVTADRIPLSDPARAWLSQQDNPEAGLIEMACGGDDYQILFTARPDSRPLIQSQADALNLTRIGMCDAGDSVRLLAGDGRTLPYDGHGGWRHFSR